MLEKLRAFSEVHLHTEIVEPLLKELKATQVRYVHGASERGKDFIFLLPTAFGDNQLAVCQVKNERLTGKANSLTTSAVATLHQLLQCRRTAVLNPSSHKKELPKDVILITTWPLPDAPLADADALLNDVHQQCRIISPELLVSIAD